jgi:hypothetical protein
MVAGGGERVAAAIKEGAVFEMTMKLAGGGGGDTDRISSTSSYESTTNYCTTRCEM